MKTERLSADPMGFETAADLLHNGSLVAFPTETVEQRSNMLDFLENIVPDDHFVFLFTVVKNENANIRADEWALDSLETGTNVFGFLEAEGAQLIRELETFGSVPYILIYQKKTKLL